MAHPSVAAPLPWPPPALEPIHGKLRPAIALIGLADVVLVLPILVSLGTPSPLGSLGPFGDAFWVPLASTVLGSVALVAGLQLLFRLLWNARDAARHGHGWRTVLYVAADEPRDTGFLLVGARAFAGLGPGQRDTLLAARLYAAALALAAVLLMPFGLGLAIVLGRLNWAGQNVLWTTALILPLVLLLGGLVGNGAAGLLARAALRGAPRRQAMDPELHRRVLEWNERLQTLRGDRPTATGGPGKARVFGAGALAIVVLALVAVGPAMLLTVVGTVSSVIVAIATPSLAGTQIRIAAAEVLRRYRLDPDPSISPEAAGQALQALVWTGRAEDDRPAGERRPVRSHAGPWWPADGAERYAQGAGWTDSLFARARRRSESGYLRQVAAHPAHAEFATIARAAAADIVGTRYELPFAEELSMMTLPFPPFGGLRLGAQAHIAKAAIELADGRPQRAERTIREVISTGLVLIDHGPTLIETLIGAVLVGTGGDALEALYRATRRTPEAETLAWVRGEVRRGAERVAGRETRLRAMPTMVLDTSLAAGMRWELFGIVAAFAPCANLRSIAFGPGADYENWLASARERLVRRPNDEALFALMQRGLFGAGRCIPLLGSVRIAGQMR
ncbi:MAG: hypothetical protein HYV20_05300 [Gemmatimonadetes bacterium]|nr:hypothetical protein [Gemmatimonadota bacterium]